jgi:hypothetical protein
MGDGYINIQDKIHTLGHIEKSGMPYLHQYKHKKNTAFHADQIENHFTQNWCSVLWVKEFLQKITIKDRRSDTFSELQENTCWLVLSDTRRD